MRNIFQISAAAAIAFTLFCTNVQAQVPTLGFGVDNDVVLANNTADQRVDLFVSNIAGKAYDTFELFIILGDGGAANGGTESGPRLTDVELGAPGTVFEGGELGSFDPGSQTDYLWADFIDSAVAQNDGFLGTLVFDTTGVAAGSVVDIRFSNIDVGGSIFNSNFRNSTSGEDLGIGSDGFLRAVPEPSSAIVLLAMTGLMGLRRRR